MANHKKAQVKMTETVFILLIFFILLGLGLIFYGNVQKTLIGKGIKEGFEKKAVLISQKATFMPEVQCSFKNNIIDSCYDLYKLQGFAEKADPE
jgi:hypothetical protein